jgi:hypothetical protein
MDKKIEFLYSAISDAQELIRFVDAKTAVAITILAAYLVAFFSAIDNVVEYHSYYSFWFWLFLSAFLILIACSIIVTARIIRPTNNPKDNVNFNDIVEPKLKYFLTPNDYSKGNFYPFINSSSFKLKESFEAYINQLSGINDEDILNTLTFELFKVSFIRNIKNDRFNILLWLLVATTVSFLISYFYFIIETHQTTEYLKEIHRDCCGL